VERGSLSGERGAYRPVGKVGESTVPATVQAVLAARIDRLADHEKVVLQTAAVIGKDFAEPVLHRVAGLGVPELAEALRALTRAELLYETALYPQAEYSFKHPLTQEVAYRSQLGERRAATHGAVARALETVHGGKLDERAGLLAYHWECAGEKWTAAEWHGRAADWIGVRDLREKDRHWRQVRTLLAGVPA